MTLSGGYRGTGVEERGFDDHIVTQHDLFGTASYVLPLNDATAVFPFAVLSRILADPADFDRTSIRTGATIAHVLAPDLVLTSDAQLQAVFYPDFSRGVFEALDLRVIGLI